MLVSFFSRGSSSGSRIGRWTFPRNFSSPIEGATFRQPRGQRPIGDAPWHVSTRRHLLPAAVLRGGGGIRGGEMVMEPLVPPF